MLTQVRSQDILYGKDGNPEFFLHMPYTAKMSLLGFVHQLITDFCKQAEFFKIGGGGEKDGYPVFFVHVPGGKD